ncbi:Hyaluronan/mRNA-binding protein [Cynara cardunculus var. scolymus]|uniref:Hyaluronan/mRNA-binding protein n=1 Tax=Cynara cardunculus var. scolymus TaxID=59895 RepID=A0A103WVA0_CYNCS|nr:Hyaluronan/mRNA-binding protein [Cynara cardunculus var. scolymus]
MATANPFDLLGDDDNDDPSQLVEKIASAPAKRVQAAPPTGKAAVQSAKLPSKPLSPAQAVKEARNEGARGGRGGRGFGRGRGGGTFNRDSGSSENSFGNRGFSGDQGAVEESDAGKAYERRGGYGGARGAFRGGRRGGFSNGDVEDGERSRRPYERRSGTGRGETEEVVIEGEKTVGSDKPLTEEVATDERKENAANEPEDKEPENKFFSRTASLVFSAVDSDFMEMTLEEYQKVLEEKRKALEALKTEERKVEVDKELASMQQLSNKKSSDDIFVKLGTDKDKRKEIAEKEERAKKFLKPAVGERYYTPGGRGRGRGPRGGGRFSQGGSSSSYAPEAPKIEDPSHFPTLGGKWMTVSTCFDVLFVLGQSTTIIPNGGLLK